MPAYDESFQHFGSSASLSENNKSEITMLELDASQIQMGRVVANKGEALAMLGDALAGAGLATQKS